MNGPVSNAGLEAQEGMHMISMEEFLKRQQSEVDIPRRPNATDFWGQKLWRYLKKSADVKPEYSGQVVAMGRLNPTAETKAKDAEALKKQAAGRKVAAYDSKAQNARHVHFRRAASIVYSTTLRLRFFWRSAAAQLLPTTY